MIQIHVVRYNVCNASLLHIIWQAEVFKVSQELADVGPKIQIVNCHIMSCHKMWSTKQNKLLYVGRLNNILTHMPASQTKWLCKCSQIYKKDQNMLL